MNSVQITTQPLIVEHDEDETHYTVCVVGNANERAFRNDFNRQLLEEMHKWCQDTIGEPKDYDTKKINWHRSYLSFVFRSPQHATLFIVTFQGREY